MKNTFLFMFVSAINSNRYAVYSNIAAITRAHFFLF